MGSSQEGGQVMKLRLPIEVRQILQLDVAECRDYYGFKDCGGFYFETNEAGWRSAIDDYRTLGWELPEEVVEQWALQVEALLDC
jgi:hypothetical protein